MSLRDMDVRRQESPGPPAKAGLNEPVTLGAAPEMPGAIFGKSTDIETKGLNVKSQTGRQNKSWRRGAANPTAALAASIALRSEMAKVQISLREMEAAPGGSVKSG